MTRQQRDEDVKTMMTITTANDNDKTTTTTTRRQDDKRHEIGNATISHNEGILPPLAFVKPSPPPCCRGCDMVVVQYSGLLGPTLV
jgi:hypothetical protein